jgi:hypothetical protein
VGRSKLFLLHLLRRWAEAHPTFFKEIRIMQTFQIEVDDNIADKVLWFLENLKENITIKKLDSLVIESDFEKSMN